MGKIVLIDGADCVGKTSQAQELVKRLAYFDRKDPIFLEFPPPGTALGQLSRSLLRTLKASFDEKALADQELALLTQCSMTMGFYSEAHRVMEALNLGSSVVLARYWTSAYAYGLADGLDPLLLMRVHSFLPQPNLAILLDMDPNDAFKRRPNVKSDEKYEQNLNFQATVRQNYLNLWRSNSISSTKWRVLNADRPFSVIATDIWRYVEQL